MNVVDLRDFQIKHKLKMIKLMLSSEIKLKLSGNMKDKLKMIHV